MSQLHTAYFADRIPYTGHELSPHWISKRTGIFASSIVAFRGPCDVATGEMVDLEDSRQNAFIKSAEMLHFLGEWFDGDLTLAIARQRLLIAGFGELLARHLPRGARGRVMRRGNDLFLEDGEERAKLSVSIVTATPVSTLFHFGVNIDATGAPVKAVGLSSLELNPDVLARETLQLWATEWWSMERARCKVAAR